MNESPSAYWVISILQIYTYKVTLEFKTRLCVKFAMYLTLPSRLFGQ